MITSLVIKTIGSSKENKKARCVITYVSLKDLYKIIKEFENLPYEGYVRNMSKYEPIESYFYLARQLAKCTMRLNFHVAL